DGVVVRQRPDELARVAGGDNHDAMLDAFAVEYGFELVRGEHLHAAARQLQRKAAAGAARSVRRHHQQQHVLFLVHALADRLHAGGKVAAVGQGDVFRAAAVVGEPQRVIADRQYLRQRGECAVDLLGEDVKTGPAGDAERVDVGGARLLRTKP